ncbi:tRNA pseudouridine(38-40) synthase TruA, partial [Rhodobacteraceae bacterium]|nr:tRNA pseudouridine(38-40) synthase TruA [Paracoccaceae bacterium]
VKKALDAKDRSACGPVSPPHGLYLKDVLYNSNPFA